MENLDPLSSASTAQCAVFPPDLSWTQRAAAMLRAFLEQNDLPDYPIFYSRELDLHDLEEHLARLDPRASWVRAPSSLGGGETIGLATQTYSIDQSKSLVSGFLHLHAFELVLARWIWVAPGSEGSSKVLVLIAARDAKSVARLRDALRKIRREGADSVWQIVSGYSYQDKPRVPRQRDSGEELILQPALLQRITSDVLSFFDAQVAKLYATLNVPYRRGVLMYGPPGNGKTSIIRWIGGKLADIPAMIVRPGANFDADDFAEIIRRWKSQAPAILVVEDLDSVVKSINVSTFLNTLDGIDSSISGGLLLIATTNHPEQLDPAINNRPGRFDVSIEVPSPAREMRAQLLARKLPEISPATIEFLADASDGCAFAHLHEIVRLSGLYAIHGGRTERSDDDVRRAMNDVSAAREAAATGFPPKPDGQFGLAHLHAMRRRRN